jgi:hypothetical protein
MKKQESQKHGLSLLDVFAGKKIDLYEEPERRGTPRGEPIGFTKRKYIAALLCSKDIKQKQIAEITKVSHAMLRKWRTEDKFLEVTDNFMVEFVDHLIRHLEKRAKKQLQLTEKYFELSLLDMTKTPPHELTWTEFRDVLQYDSFIIIRTLNKLLKRISDMGKKSANLKMSKQNLALYYQFVDFLEIGQHYFSKKHNIKISSSQSQFYQEFKEQDKMIRQKFNLLSLRWDLESKKSVSEENLKNVIFTLHHSSESFIPVDMDL